MATFLRRFTRPDFLRAIAPTRLVEFLRPHQEFLTARSLHLPTDAKADQLDYEGLARILMSPEPDTPTGLIDALFYVDEMSTPDAMDGNLAAARENGLPLDESAESSPADVALQIWMLAPEVLERCHAERSMLRVRAFQYFQTDRRSRPAFRPMTAKQLQALEHDLDGWFVDKKRGRGTRVFVFPKLDGIWFLVRHGEPFKRDERMCDNASTSSVCYRPAKYDVLVYQPKVGELRINAQSKGVKELYRRQFGKHVFGDENFFPGEGKFTLEPLRKYGRSALVCTDVAGIESVVLKQVELHWGGPQNEVEIRKADDVFAALEARGETLPDEPRLTNAVFSVKFADSKRARTVRIRPSNVAQFTRDADADRLDEWFVKRGFVDSQADREHEAA